MGAPYFIYWGVHMSRNSFGLCFILCLSDIQLIKVINRRPGIPPAGTNSKHYERAKQLYKKRFFSRHGVFLCRLVHYPGAQTNGRKTQENELKRLAALPSVVAAKYHGGIPGGACIQERHPAARKGVFCTFVWMATAHALYSNIYYYRQTFTIFPIYTKFLLPGRYFAPRYHFF